MKHRCANTALRFHFRLPMVCIYITMVVKNKDTRNQVFIKTNFPLQMHQPATYHTLASPRRHLPAPRGITCQNMGYFFAGNFI